MLPGISAYMDEKGLLVIGSCDVPFGGGAPGSKARAILPIAYLTTIYIAFFFT